MSGMTSAIVAVLAVALILAASPYLPDVLKTNLGATLFFTFALALLVLFLIGKRKGGKGNWG
jgi:hypothetical protein